MSLTPPAQPSFFYGWIVVAGAWFVYMLNQAAFTWGFTVFVNPLAEEYGWSRTSITIAWALSLGWGLLLGPRIGRWFDRYGARPIMAMGGVLGGLGWLLIPTATSYWSFLMYLVLLVGSGVNGALSPSIGSAAIAQWFQVRRSLALGVYFTGSGGAGLLLIPMMSALAQTHGWRTSASALGVTMLLITTAAVPLMRHRPEQYGLLPDGYRLSHARARKPRVWDAFKQLPFPKHVTTLVRDASLSEAMRSAPFWLFTAAIFLRFVGMGVIQVHQVPHMLSQGINPMIAATVLSISLIVNIPSRIVIGWMGDHYSKKWLLILLAVAGGMALWAFALVSPAFTTFAWIYAVLWGIGLAMLPLQAAWIADTYGRTSYGSINTMSHSISLSGRVVGALSAGLAFDYFGSYEEIILLGAVGFGIGAVLLLFLPSPERIQ